MWFIFYHHLSLSKLYEHLCFLIGLKKQKKTLNTPCLKKILWDLKFAVVLRLEVLWQKYVITKMQDLICNLSTVTY